MSHPSLTGFGLALIDKEIYPIAEARIPLNDRGFLFGQAVFETLLIRSGHIIDLQGHLARLLRSCAHAGIALSAAPQSAETELTLLAHHLVQEFYRAVQTLIGAEAVPEVEAQMRIIVTGGSSFTLHDLHCVPHFYLYCLALPARHSGKNQERPLALKLFSDLRHPMLVAAKTTHYLPALLALQAAQEAGFSDALYYNARNEISESTTANFIWEDFVGKIWTAPCELNCLKGTSLTLLEKSQASLGHPISYKALQTKQIGEICRSAYLISSVKRVRAVSQIDQFKLDVKWGEHQAARFNQILDQESNAYAAHHFR